MLLVNGIDRLPLELMLDRYGLAFVLVAPEEVIPEIGRAHVWTPVT